MNYGIRIAILISAFGLNACAPHIHNLAPEKASAGRLQHASGIDKLELTYAGKAYSGEFDIKSSRYIDGEQQRYPGRIARAVLAAKDGDTLTCDLQWPNASTPSGVCKDKKGTSFPVRFD